MSVPSAVVVLHVSWPLRRAATRLQKLVATGAERLTEFVFENELGRFEYASAQWVLKVPAHIGHLRLAASIPGDGVAPQPPAWRFYFAAQKVTPFYNCYGSRHRPLVGSTDQL